MTREAIAFDSTDLKNFDLNSIPKPDVAEGRIVPHSVSVLQMEQERRHLAEKKADWYFVGGLLGTLAGTILGWLLGKIF